MLVLTRRLDQSVLVGGIRVTVVGLRQRAVILAVNSPNSGDPARLVRADIDEPVEIGLGAAITVGRIRGDQIRLCIDAPGEIRVLREELANNACSA